MTLHVKICGITDVSSAVAAAEAGADAVGFVFTDSIRRIEPGVAARIASELPGRIERVAVFLRPSPGDVARVLSEFPADIVQADNGSISHTDGPQLLPVFREGDDEVLAGFLEGTVARRFHYEGRSSGSGVSVDWEHARRFAEDGLMTLAGGLDPDNLSVALATVQPFGVDVSSGVESAPGVKDIAKIKDFIETARQSEKAVTK